MLKLAPFLALVLACGGARPAAPAPAAPAAAAEDHEQPDDQCCCEATMVNEDNQEESTHAMMGETACTRKTDDGKCVDASLCAATE